jgi:predicted nucleic acid-binding protein
MITADTSAWIDYLKGVDSKQARSLQDALVQNVVVIAPIVFVEVMSGPGITHAAESLIADVPRMELTTGYWERAALMRRSILKRGNKARLGDCLIAQSCIDHGVPLIAEDRDFRHFARFGLKLVQEH